MEKNSKKLNFWIKLAKTYLNVGNINILDTSCSPRPLAREGLRSFEGYRRIFHNKKYLDPNFVTSHGTKRKRNIEPDKPQTKRRKKTPERRRIRLVIKSKPKTRNRTTNQKTNPKSKVFKTRNNR